MKKVNIVLLSLAAVLSIGTATLASSYKNTLETSATVGNYSTDAATYYKGITATSGDALLAQLHDLMCNTHKSYTSYDDCKTPAYVYTMEPGSTSSYVMDFYTQRDIGKSWGAGATGTWTREHVWCQSQSIDSEKSGDKKQLWGQSNGGSDLHHIRPIEDSLNTSRNNNKFGELSSLGLNRDSNKTYSKDSSGKQLYHGGYVSKNDDIFEPLDSVKGDVARILLYVYTHYRSYNYITGATTDGALSNHSSTGKISITNIVRTASGSGTTDESAFALLLKWNTNDPVSDAERVRNEQAAKYQGNRNPFIDHPEYANAIWGNSSANTVTLSSTSGSVAVNSTLVINATATQSGTFGCSSTNTSIATVSGKNNLSTGKYDVTITGKAVGTTTITVRNTYNSVQSTATFTVTVYNPSATKTLSSISLSGDYPTEFTVGDTFSHSGMTVTANYNDSTTADVTSSATFNGYTMSTAGVQEVTVSYTEGGVTKTETYFITINTPSTSNTYELYSGTLTEGDYIVYYNEKAIKASVSNERLSYESVTPSNDIIATADTSIIWHIAPSGDYWTLYNSAEAKYAASTGAKNKAQLLDDGTDDMSLWTVTGNSTYEFVNKQNTANNVNANLRNNGTYGFACYASSTGGALSLYKRTSAAPVEITYTVTYDANGGTGTLIDDDSPYDSGEYVTTLENTFTKDGYTFDHWNTAKDNTGTSYDEGDDFIISSDITLYAQWEAESVDPTPGNATFDFTKIDGFSDWGSGYTEHVVNYTEGTVTFASANKNGQTITDKPVTKGSDVSFVAKDGLTLTSASFVCEQWGSKAQTITLHYSTDGGVTYTSTGITSINFTISSSSLPSGTNAIKITFSSSSNQIGIASLTISYSTGGDTPATTYTVTYDANGATSGTVPVDNTEYESGTNATVLGNTGNLAKDGFTWIGWNTEDDGTGTTYSADDPLEMTANVTLYAKWQENTPTPPSEDDVEVVPSDGQCFYKVSSTEELLSGKYLIVCESIGVAFDGSMGNLDVVNKALDVTIANRKIAASDLVSKTFTITVNGNNTTIQSSSGIYIGRTADSNGMNTSTSTAYANTISFDEGNANIVGSGGAYLRFNSASNEGRFRYYKSATYTGQNAIQLYRLYDAEKYSKDFLSTVTCSGSGSITATGTFWSTMNSKFTSNLSSAEQSKLTSGTANIDGTTYLARALARYDAIVSKYGTKTYANFMSRSIPSVGLNILVLTNNNTSSWLIIVISVISLSAISLYIFKRRKKYDN